MLVFSALCCLLVGGFAGGSFALPTKNIQQWNFENIWLNYAAWTFLVLPWIGIFLLAPNIWSFYQNMPIHLLWILTVGGVLYGIGQVCFAQSLKMIGFGLGFMINIGLGTGLGFLLPLIILHPEKILTPFGYATLTGVVLIVVGLLISYCAGKQRNICIKQIQPSACSNHYQAGVALTVIAGFCAAIQNFTFAITNDLQKTALNAGINHLAAAMIIWPIFLAFAFIPYAIYMLHLHRKNKSFSNYRGSRTKTNFLLSLFMGLCWLLALVLYSQASLLIGSLGPVVGWPLYMVIIILASNFWGWQHHEWSQVQQRIKRQMLLAISLLVLAVAALAYSTTFA